MDGRQRGVIRTWRDDKGFGFITPTSGEPDLFFHISSITNSRRRDLIGQRVTYIEQPGEKGKPRATSVRLAVEVENDMRPSVPRSNATTTPAITFSMLFIAAISAAALKEVFPWYLPLVYVAVSLLTYMTYSNDKNSALAGDWREPEANLHLMELLGGWPGALIAQWRLRHKNRKASYQVAFWFIVILHFAAITLYLYSMRSST